MVTTKKIQTKQAKVNSISFKDKQVGGSLLSEWSSRCEDFMLSRDSLFDSGHRIDHVRRVLHNALTLASHEDAQIDIILPAVWLHDCVPVDKHSPKRSMASQLSADYALSLLSQWSYPSSLLQPIHHAIAAHSFSANITPTTLEAKIVQDADRLDALGAIGIARVIMVGAQHNNALYAADEPFPSTRALDDKQFIIDHFYTKLLTLHQSFHTTSGKNEAMKRTQIMQQYLDTLGHEIGISAIKKAIDELLP